MREKNLENHEMLKFIKSCDYTKEFGGVVIWIPFYRLNEFTQLVGGCFLNEVEIRIDCVAFELTSAIEQIGFDINDLRTLLEE